ncbi:hypothetical protein C8R46DRAFT_1024393 [Mycena filopes]|nr:hypothetical protein C8R46DRAFT_1024393 [Mycena filopes]
MRTCALGLLQFSAVDILRAFGLDSRLSIFRVEAAAALGSKLDDLLQILFLSCDKLTERKSTNKPLAMRPSLESNKARAGATGPSLQGRRIKYVVMQFTIPPAPARPVLSLFTRCKSPTQGVFIAKYPQIFEDLARYAQICRKFNFPASLFLISTCHFFGPKIFKDPGNRLL